MPLGLEVFNMKFYRFLNERCNFCVGFANRNAAGKVWNVGTKTASALLDDNQIFHTRPHFVRAACFRMLFKVPGGTSTLGLPATVTVPALSPWRN